MVPTAVEISLCSGPVPESWLKSSPRLRAISLSSPPKPPAMELITVLPKPLSHALEIVWFSLIILFRVHRVIVAEVATRSCCTQGWIQGDSWDGLHVRVPGTLPSAWNVLSLNLIPTLRLPNVSASQLWLMWQ